MIKTLIAFLFLNMLILQKTDKSEITIIASDKLTVYIDFYKTKQTGRPILLLHEANSSKAEYEDIAPELAKLGYHCFAADLRNGKEINGIKNKTHAEALNKKLKTGFDDSEKDIESALDYLYQRYQQPVTIMGSSLTASYALFLAQKNKKIKAVIAFSPGEYFNKTLNLKDIVKELKQPYFISGTMDECKEYKTWNETPTSVKMIFCPSNKGEHGAKSLWKKNPGSSEYWAALKSFIANAQKF